MEAKDLHNNLREIYHEISDFIFLLEKNELIGVESIVTDLKNVKTMLRPIVSNFDDYYYQNKIVVKKAIEDGQRYIKVCRVSIEELLGMHKNKYTIH